MASATSSTFLASGLVPARPKIQETQDHGNRSRAFGIIDVDWQETALVVISVEQRELPATMNDVASIVDIENNRIRFLSVARAPLINESVGQPHNILQARRILQA